jgi:broad specificity phosphatase PhoE
MSAPILYYMRHGETVWNAEGRFQGSRDIPLNDKGRAQASAAGAILLDLMTRDGHQPDAFDYVASPLGRASTTMDLVRVALGLPQPGARHDARLREICHGHWEGLTTREMRQRDPEVYATRETRKWDIPAPAGESYAEVTERVGNWHGELRRATVAVAHGGTMRALMVALGIATPLEAAGATVEQGVVYAFTAGTMAKYG